MAINEIKSVRIRATDSPLKKPDKPGGNDGRLVLQSSGKDRIVSVFKGDTDSYYPSFVLIPEVPYKGNDWKSKTDDEIIKDFVSRNPKFSIIQDPYDPKVVPPDSSFGNTTTTSSLKYTPDATLSTESSWISSAEIKPRIDTDGISGVGEISVKSYTFNIENPKNEDEKKVKLIIWIIDLDASQYVKNLASDLRTTYTGILKSSLSTGDLMPLPTEGNYYAISKFLNSPQVNPKDNTPAKVLNPEEFSPSSSASFMSLLAAKQESTYTEGTLGSVDDYIKYIIWNQKFQYQMNVYNLVFTSAEDEKKASLPENKIEFIQGTSSTAPTGATPSVAEPEKALIGDIPPLPPEAPVVDGNTYKFTMGTVSTDIFFNLELGTFSVYTFDLDETDFNYEVEVEEFVDEEYEDVSFIGTEEELDELGKFIIPDEKILEPVSVDDPTATGGGTGDPNNPVNSGKVSIEGLKPWSRKIGRLTKGNTWQDHAANYISLKEGFTAKASWDVNHYRMGFGSEVIFKGGKKIEVQKGMTCTKEEAVTTLAKYGIPAYSKTIAEQLGQTYWDKLTGYQKAALTSLGYNVGSGYINGRGYGNRIKAAIKAGNYKEAAKEILNGPRTASGKVLSALVRRREEEAQLFLLPDNKSIY